MLCGYTTFAQGSSSFENMSIEKFVNTLDNIQGFFFIGKGENRALSLTLERDQTNDFEYAYQVSALHWSSLNPSVAFIDDDGNLDGINFGETIISSVDDEGNKTNYVVFVAPKVTIVSPEGAVYRYHKIYNQNSHVQFTQSKDYAINCVVRDGVDITESPSFNRETGWYTPDDDIITDDTTFWVTMEKRRSPNDSDAVIGSNVKVKVDGSKVTIETSDASLLKKKIKVMDMWGNTLYNNQWPSDGDLVFNPGNKGVFYIDIPDVNTYKIIIHEL